MSFWEYLTGYKQGYADGVRAAEASLKKSKEQLEEWRESVEGWAEFKEAQLQKERNEWEERKAQYVLEQLRLIKGG